MADCGSHQKNPQIANKMNNIKTKMLSYLQSQAGYPFYFYILKNGMSSRWSFFPTTTGKTHPTLVGTVYTTVSLNEKYGYPK